MLKKILLTSCMLAINTYAFAASTNVDKTNAEANFNGKYEISMKIEKANLETKGLASSTYPLILGGFETGKSSKCALPDFDKSTTVSVLPTRLNVDKNTMSTILIVNQYNYDSKVKMVLASTKHQDICKVFQENGKNAIHLTYDLSLDKPKTLELPTGDKVVFEVKKVK